MTDARAYWLREGGRPLEYEPLEIPDPSATEAVVEIDACGLCHTDLGFADGPVKPKHGMPLVLGHEITGTVVRAGESFADLVGNEVLVPAVMPCGDCPFCRAGRGNACPNQKMPGNDIHGGFATHILTPAAPLVSLADAPDSIATDSLSVVADAVSTAYQAVRRSSLESGDLAVVIGGGGVGGFTAQIASALGARVVVCDVDPRRLAEVAEHGADHTIDVRDQKPRDVRNEVRALARDWGVPSLRWRIFECSGTTAGQTQAYTLLGPAATVVFVGFTIDEVPVRLSNLMAFDATALGSWGCPVEAYPDVLKLIYDGQVVLEPFVERAPMSDINQHLDSLREHRLFKRLVLDPRA